MTEQVFGWTGKILSVDLTGSNISELETMNYADRFLGGRGVASRIYWEQVAPETGALDPGNALILMSGPLTATGVPGASRFEAVSKSPMTNPEGFCYGNLGGYFAPYLKRAGYDGVVVTGKAEKPCYIFIDDGKVEILDASFLWGKGIYETRDLLKEKHGQQVRFVTTGPAGENQCRAATLITDHEGSATGGFGAVLGSKNLKAIAVNGTGHPAVAHPDELKELIKYTMKLSERGTLRMPIPKQHAKYAGKASCYQCGLDCLRGTFKTVNGKEAVSKCGPLMFYMGEALQKGEEIDLAFDATDMVNDYSLCTNEVGSIIRWLSACYETGFLSEEDTGIEMGELGTRAFIEDLLSMISHREGFGDVLADGLLRIGDKLGDKALEFFPLVVPGVGGGSGYAPRMYNTNAMLYALEPRTPIAMLHEVSYMIARWLLHQIRPELSPTTADVFRRAATKFWGHEKAWDLTTYEGKAEASARIQDRTYIKDSLPLCDCAWPITDSFNTPDNIGDSELESKIFTAVTGIEVNEQGLLEYGERIFNQQRAILLREGWKAKEDDIPADFNFNEPVQMDGLNPRLIVPGPDEEPVSVKGRVLDRARFEEMREKYYNLRGWNPETGLQTEERLESLGLSDLAQDLKMAGHLK
jgi:aldehyde:ferredoxin oxidoreductase